MTLYPEWMRKFIFVIQFFLVQMLFFPQIKKTNVEQIFHLKIKIKLNSKISKKFGVFMIVYDYTFLVVGLANFVIFSLNRLSWIFKNLSWIHYALPSAERFSIIITLYFHFIY
ncbi:hypothetical protein BpHYR1_009239 [Brachionus plicatilis]|uniref:Uncharacterized protein n=1 Tax=Brachionus plicatilis TaxID=10195 RepID=A0A3M7PY74_BRAPC|nr:hypothetical protein BpHYR1_009239 [Brachionus plicatilis]